MANPCNSVWTDTYSIRRMIDSFMDIRFESVESHVDAKVRDVFRKLFRRPIFFGRALLRRHYFFNTSDVAFAAKEIGQCF